MIPCSEEFLTRELSAFIKLISVRSSNRGHDELINSVLVPCIKSVRARLLTEQDNMAPSMNPNAPVEALKILPNRTHQNWLKDRGLRKLNLGIAFMFASSAGTGYNGSLMNGLLVLPECMNSSTKEKAKSDAEYLDSCYDYRRLET